MITNEKEFRSTRAALAGFEEALSKFNMLEVIKGGIDPMIARAQYASFERQIGELKAQIASYESLRDGKTKKLVAQDVVEIGRVLVEARVSKGLTQRELANLAGLQEQQIQRYEKEFYGSANLRRLGHIAASIGLDFSAKITVSQNISGDNNGLPSGLSLSDFPFAEMNTREWFGPPDDLRRAPSVQKAKILSSFFAQAPEGIQAALHRKSAGSTSPARNAALLAWQARILTKAQQRTGLARKFNTPTAEVVGQIAKFSAQPDGIAKAINLLLDHGIIVVVEPHLTKTKLDGAAMCLDGGAYAVIGLTARYNRIDNFWFVLLHELGHIIRHWARVREFGIVDEMAGENSDELVEREADEFAENAILPLTVWQASAVRFTKQSSSIVEFANRHGLHPALIAGRIRRERGYTEFSEMLGSGEVQDKLRDMGFWSK